MIQSQNSQRMKERWKMIKNHCQEMIWYFWNLMIKIDFVLFISFYLFITLFFHYLFSSFIMLMMNRLMMNHFIQIQLFSFCFRSCFLFFKFFLFFFWLFQKFSKIFKNFFSFLKNKKYKIKNVIKWNCLNKILINIFLFLESKRKTETIIVWNKSIL